MNLPLIVIRPEPGCAATVAAATRQGLEAHGWPLFVVQPVAWEPAAADQFDALLVGSANVFRHGGPNLAAVRALPVHAVGTATARAAHEAGFTLGEIGKGGLQKVLDRIPSGTRLLRLAGAERLDLIPPPGVAMVEHTVYASTPVPLPAALAAHLREGAVVALHSAEGARHFAAECTRQDIARNVIALVTIGPRVTAAAGPGWKSIHTAATPDETALLAIAHEVCHTNAGNENEMAEDLQTASPAAATAPAAAPSSGAPAPRRRGAGRAILGAALIAFIAGAGAVGYAAWEGLVPLHQASSVSLVSPAADRVPPAPPPHDDTVLAGRQSGLEDRIAMLEQRLDAINVQADAASGNAARAEALLVAFAARRAIDRGAPLGFLEDQLRLRFGNAQPNAVATVIDTGRTPVTLDQLLAGLDSLAPGLTDAPRNLGAWSRIKHEMAGLFVFRRETTPSPQPQKVVQRARLLLEAGRSAEAIDALRRLPGSADAADWFAAAGRYETVHRALDVLETAAMLDTRGLRDAAGQAVDRPGPVVPTPQAAQPATPPQAPSPQTGTAPAAAAI